MLRLQTLCNNSINIEVISKMLDVLLDTLVDALKTLPFLFGAYLIIEFIEHRSADKFAAWLGKFGKAGAVVGALLGVVPQCGFSVAAANLYSNRMITAGTLIAVFISTSDEAIPVLLANPQSAEKILPLIGAKLVLAIVAGLVIDLSGVLKANKQDEEAVVELHSHCDTEGEGGIVKSAVHHTLETFVFLIIVMLVLNVAIALIGQSALESFLMSGTLFQPILAGLVGLIPNCAASVVLSQLYAEGAISFGSAVAGLSAGAGVGLLVLFRTDLDKSECIRIAITLFAISVLTGMVLQFTIG